MWRRLQAVAGLRAVGAASRPSAGQGVELRGCRLGRIAGRRPAQRAGKALIVAVRGRGGGAKGEAAATRRAEVLGRGGPTGGAEVRRVGDGLVRLGGVRLRGARGGEVARVLGGQALGQRLWEAALGQWLGILLLPRLARLLGCILLLLLLWSEARLLVGDTAVAARRCLLQLLLGIVWLALKALAMRGLTMPPRVVLPLDVSSLAVTCLVLLS